MTPDPLPLHALVSAQRALEASREARDAARRALRLAPGEAPPAAAAALERAERTYAEAAALVARLRADMSSLYAAEEKAWSAH